MTLKGKMGNHWNAAWNAKLAALYDSIYGYNDLFFDEDTPYTLYRTQYCLPLCTSQWQGVSMPTAIAASFVGSSLKMSGHTSMHEVIGSITQ